MDVNIVWMPEEVAELPFTSEGCRTTGEPRGGNHAQGTGQSFTERHTTKLRFKSLGKEKEQAI